MVYTEENPLKGKNPLTEINKAPEIVGRCAISPKVLIDELNTIRSDYALGAITKDQVTFRMVDATKKFGKDAGIGIDEVWVLMLANSYGVNLEQFYGKALGSG